jgi:hypothetical protein
MSMRHGLPGLRAGIEYDPVSGFVDPRGGRHQVGLLGHLVEQPITGGGQRDKVGIVISRNYQHMNRSLRVDITERYSARAFQHANCRDVTRGDAAEKALCHAADLNLCPAQSPIDIYGCTTANPRRTTPLDTARQSLAFRGPVRCPRQSRRCGLSLDGLGGNGIVEASRRTKILRKDSA